MNQTSLQLNRRQFLKAGAAASGGLLVSVGLASCATSADSSDADEHFVANAWVEITPDDEVFFTLDKSEMGQGTYTGLTTIVAEELKVDPAAITVKFAPVAKEYKHPDYGMMIVGGSTSVSAGYMPLRQAGAGAREALLKAAAKVWQVPKASCTAEAGHCLHAASGRKLSYGQLAALAAEQSVPSNPPLTPPAQFRYIGKHNQRLDADLKSFGKAQFGIDTQLPGMLYATVARAPHLGGRVKTFNAEAAKASRGVVDVFAFDGKIAVVADSYWRARKARDLLEVEWDKNSGVRMSTDEIFAHYQSVAENKRGSTLRKQGSPEAAMNRPGVTTVQAEYKVPFLAHATMEPQNCTALVKDGHCEVWAPTQAQDTARYVAARAAGLSQSRVKVNTTFLGGGFGRRLTQDFVAEAVAISAKVQRPVKLVWSREDDTQNDLYRPAMYNQLQGAVDENGQLVAWEHQLVGPKVLTYFSKDAVGALVPPWTPTGLTSGVLSPLASSTYKNFQLDVSPFEGAKEVPYAADNVAVHYAHADTGVPVAFWRSVGHSHTGFTVESFIDEMAHAAGRDPYAFRHELLQQHPRHLRVLEIAARQANWGKPEAGRFQGIAVHKSFGSFVAQVAEVRVEGSQIKVEKVTCAVDCGLVVNPDIVRAQMESGIIYGLSAALYGKITLDKGKVQESNFHNYQPLRINETPEMHVTIVHNHDEPPTGVGEPGLPPIAPAVANAVFAATGQRLRELPLQLG